MASENFGPINAFVGQRIRAVREIEGIARDDLAHALGIPIAQVEGYETGTDWIGPCHLIRIGRILGREIQWFYRLAPASPIGADAAAE